MLRVQGIRGSSRVDRDCAFLLPGALPSYFSLVVGLRAEDAVFLFEVDVLDGECLVFDDELGDGVDQVVHEEPVRFLFGVDFLVGAWDYLEGEFQLA